MHGGPGSTTSHYTSEHFLALQQHFVVIHWDQRGAGKTFVKQIEQTPFDDFLVSTALSVQQLVDDGIEVTNYLLQRFDRDKLILRGGSWGAYLAMHMLHVKPELFYAYVGHAQVVNAHEKLSYGYKSVMGLAEQTGDDELLSMLKTLSAPPYDHPRKYGQLMRIIKQAEAGVPSTQNSSLIDGYDSEQDKKNRSLADDYSWIHFVGLPRMGINGMQDEVQLEKLGSAVKVPLFILQGAKDRVTPPQLTEDYLSRVSAPIKEYLVINDSGHEPSDKMLSAELSLLTTKVRALVLK